MWLLWHHNKTQTCVFDGVQARVIDIPPISVVVVLHSCPLSRKNPFIWLLLWFFLCKVYVCSALLTCWLKIKPRCWRPIFVTRIRPNSRPVFQHVAFVYMCLDLSMCNVVVLRDSMSVLHITWFLPDWWWKEAPACPSRPRWSSIEASSRTDARRQR